MVSVPNTFLDVSLDGYEDGTSPPRIEIPQMMAAVDRPPSNDIPSNIASYYNEVPIRSKPKPSKYGKAKIIDHRRANPQAIVPIDLRTTPEIEIRIPIVNVAQPNSDNTQLRPPRRLSERAIVSPRKSKYQPQMHPPNFSYPRNSKCNNQQAPRSKSLSESQSKPLPRPPGPSLTPLGLTANTAHKNPHARNTTEPAPIPKAAPKSVLKSVFKPMKALTLTKERQSLPGSIPIPSKTFYPTKDPDTEIQKYISTSLASILDRSLKLEAHLAIPRTRWSTSTLGDGAEENHDDAVDLSPKPDSAVVKPDDCGSGGAARPDDDVPVDRGSCTIATGRASLGGYEEWGDASASSPGNGSGRASTLIESDVSSIFSIEEPTSAATPSLPPRRPSKKLSLFPPTTAVPEKEANYKLHCEFCTSTFLPAAFENWFEHTLTHFSPYPPPQSARCIFCDGFPTVEATLMLDPEQYWRERMMHLAEHFQDGKILAEAGEDEGTVGYMLERALAGVRPRRRRSHIEFEDESLERMERAREREWRREREKQVVVHNAREEAIQRKREGKRRSRSDAFPVVLKAKEIRIRRSCEEDKPKYLAVKSEMVPLAPTPIALPVIKRVDTRKGVRCDIY